CSGNTPASRITRSPARSSFSVPRGSPELVPAIHPNSRDDLKVGAQRPDHGRFTFGEVGRAGDAVERITVADDREVASGAYRRGQNASQRRVALSVRRSARPAAHFLHFLGAPEEELRGFHSAAERTGGNALHGNAQTPDCRSRSACIGPAPVDEVALIGAILVALHFLVVLAEVGRRMTAVRDVAVLEQLCQQLRRRDLVRWKRTALRFSRL